MVRSIERLKNYSLVGLDTSVFIYHFEKNQKFNSTAMEILDSIEVGNNKAITSVITLIEVIVKPLALNRIDIARKYEILIKNFPNLHIVDLDHESAHKAALLRAQYQIKPADALQIAACMQNGAEIFITNDQRLEKLRSLMDILILSENANG